MPRELLVVVLAGVAVAVAAGLRARSRPPAPTRSGTVAPEQLDRNDFHRPDAEWLVALFSSATCLACHGTWQKVALLESEVVAVQDVTFQGDRDLHERYAVDAVPLVLVADAEGVVRSTFIGPPSAADLWASVADLRAPGSVPPGCDHHGSV